MDKTDAAQPISTVLNGSNYRLWAQSMRSCLKGRKLWRIVTGDITAPKKADSETTEKFNEKLEDWDSKNHQILSWFMNSTVPSIHSQFGQYETAKEVWDLLEKRYTTSDLASQYQLWQELHKLKQERGESIISFLAKMESLWDQISQADPTFSPGDDTEKFIAHRDRMRLIQFLMALTDDFEPCRASLLHQTPLPSLEVAVSRLLSDETRLGLQKPKSEDMVFAAASRTTYGGKSKFCKHCDKPGHTLAECRLVECRVCKKKGHIASFCPNIECNLCRNFGHSAAHCHTHSSRTNQYRGQSRTNQSSRSVSAAAATEEKASDPSPNSNSTSNIETLLKQMLSLAPSNSNALSTISGSADGTDSWDRTQGWSSV